MTLPLLRTKLYRPRPTRLLVPRPALVERLDDGFAKDLVLVVAPVGFGKTTMVAAWAAQAPQPSAWLALDEHDNDPILFLTYLIAAIRTLFPDACPETSATVRGNSLPDDAVLTTLLLNEIDDLPQRFTLVLDDYHVIRAPAVHRLLDSILRHPPLQMGILIASRADPPFALARLRANDGLLELRGRDLRFSPGEATDFLAQAVGREQAGRAADVLVRCTEGWIAGMQLAALSLRTAADQEAMLQALERGVDRFIMDYLFEQVLQQQSTEVQTFLLKTSILERMTQPLVQELTTDEEPPHLPVTLADIERAGLFVNALDNTGEWFAYHALFRELLRHQLQLRFEPREIAALHRRASAWFARNHLIDEALDHGLAAGDVAGAARLVIDHFVHRIGREDWRAVERWLELLPAAIFDQVPWLLVVQAYVLQLRSNWDAMSHLLREAETRLAGVAGAVRSAEEAVLRGYLDMLWTIHWSRNGQSAEVIAVARHALEILPAEHLYVRGAIQTALVMALQVAGDAVGAIQMVQGELALAPRSTERAYYGLRILLNLLSVELAEGNIAPAEQLATTLLHEAVAFDAPISQLWAHLALGICAYECNDLVRAVAHFAQGAEFRRAGHVRGGHECLVDLALAYQALGRTADAHRVAALLADYHWQMGNPELTAEGISLRVHLAVLNGQLPGDLTGSSVSSPLPAIWFGWTEIPAKTRVHALVATATPSALAEAAQIVDELLALATAIRKPRRMAEFLALKACVQERRGQRDEARTTLEAAVALGEPRGLIRALADAGAQLKPLVQRLAEERPSPYLARVLAALPAPAPQVTGVHDGHPVHAPAVRLTRREREVLALLAAHLTDREIAEKLVVSPLTVRTHIEHIGEKLGASGRRAIIAQAIQQGLLP